MKFSDLKPGQKFRNINSPPYPIYVKTGLLTNENYHAVNAICLEGHNMGVTVFIHKDRRVELVEGE